MTLRNSSQRPATLDPLDERIVDEMADRPEGLSTAEIADTISRTPRATRTRLKSLVEQGVVVEFGTGPHDPLRRYLLAEDPARYGRWTREP